MVLIAGRQGRATAGVTWTTSSVATMILGASGNRLPLERLYLAPHAPTFATPRDGDLSECVALEPELRGIWCSTRATVELGELMFAGHPRYSPAGVLFPDISDPTVTEVSEMPIVRSPDDMRALVTRLRVVLEDPRQLLSGCVVDFAVEQLAANHNDPAAVTVPGLDVEAFRDVQHVLPGARPFAQHARGGLTLRSALPAGRRAFGGGRLDLRPRVGVRACRAIWRVQLPPLPEVVAADRG